MLSLSPVGPMIFFDINVSFHKYDTIFASALYGLYNELLSALHCKRPYRSPPHILCSTKPIVSTISGKNQK